MKIVWLFFSLARQARNLAAAAGSYGPPSGMGVPALTARFLSGSLKGRKSNSVLTSPGASAFSGIHDSAQSALIALRRIIVKVLSWSSRRRNLRVAPVPMPVFRFRSAALELTL
ncbi:hypothetical protein [Paraburkholderia graminis]|uniref:hypothetical protein n=1 Tax=Paraburkholderia graminis TaxID=60548 RepID=UPI00129076A6|nr:hypothetical protein [Paraburkholderia graminis]